MTIPAEPPALSNSRWSGDPATDPPFPPPTDLGAETLPELFANFAVARDHKPFARTRDIFDGEWIIWSWREALFQVLQLATYLKNVVKINRGDRVAILSATRYEWVLADLAIMAAGGVSVSIYHSLLSDDVGFILFDSDATAIFVENDEQLKKVVEAETHGVKVGDETTPLSPRTKIAFEKISTPLNSQCTELHSLLSSDTSSKTLDTAADELRAMIKPATQETTATIVYTSGTTGLAKGVVQTHGNHLSMLQSAGLSGLMGDGSGLFLFLPLAHSFARLIEYVALATGGDLIFPAIVDRKSSKFDAKQVLSDLAASGARVFPSVPRLFEKIMEGFLSSRSPTRKLVAWAVQARMRGATGITGAIAAKIVKGARKKIFGKSFGYAISGGAPITTETIRFFDALDATIFEGYGLTETCPAIAANTARYRKIGSVGRPFPCNEVKFDPEDGEIIVRGGNIAQGYWKRPEETEVAWKDGWFHTGDIGRLDEDGFLFITDRKKDLIVTAGGKKIPPTLLEGKLRDSPLISQAFVYGERRPYIVALITINPDNVRSALGHNNDTSIEALARDPEVQRLIESVVSKLNSSLASFEQVKRFHILGEDFTIENGMLSPTLKPKRKVIYSRFESEIAALYQ